MDLKPDYLITAIDEVYPKKISSLSLDNNNLFVAAALEKFFEKFKQNAE